MSDSYWLTDEQMALLQSYFPKSPGRERVDDRRILSGIIFVNHNVLKWRDAPKEYGPSKTLYNLTLRLLLGSVTMADTIPEQKRELWLVLADRRTSGLKQECENSCHSATSPPDQFEPYPGGP